MTGNKHSIAFLQRLQPILEKYVSDKHGVKGVGIGMNAARTDYVFRVLVESEEDAGDLPKQVEGVEVQHQVTGPIRAAR